MTDIQVRKIGYRVPVNIRDGVPRCPHCKEPMVPTGGGVDYWVCPMWPKVKSVLDDMQHRLDEQLGVPS